MIELSLTIEIYIAGVKNRAGFATGPYDAQISIFEQSGHFQSV